MKIAGELLPLLEVCLGEHDRLVKAAGLGHLVRRQGWIEVMRSAETLDAGAERVALMARDYGLVADLLDRGALARLEPSLMNAAMGGIHWRDPYSITDPGALTKGYASLFEERGGTILRGAVMSLVRDGAGWQVKTDGETHSSMADSIGGAPVRRKARFPRGRPNRNFRRRIDFRPAVG